MKSKQVLIFNLIPCSNCSTWFWPTLQRHVDRMLCDECWKKLRLTQEKNKKENSDA